MEIREAYKKARNAEPNLDLLEVYECDDKWIFDFGEIDKNGKLLPDTPNITVSKYDGKVGYITIPPIENLKIFKGAKKLGTDWIQKFAAS